MGSSKMQARRSMRPKPSLARTRPMPIDILDDQQRFKHISGRIKRLPKELESAREYLGILEAEARALGMDDLL